MINYMGMEFKNHDELKAHTKEGHISYYKKLCKLAGNNFTMELNVMMCKQADVLIKHFGMTLAEVEQIELEAMAA